MKKAKQQKTKNNDPALSADELKQLSMGNAEKTYECCVPADKRKYENKLWNWKNRLFFKANIAQLFHMPSGMDRIMSNDYPRLLNSGNVAENIWLIREKNAFSAELLIPIKRKEGKISTTIISGRFVSKLFQGKSYKQTNEWVKDMLYYCETKEYDVKKLLFFYPLCPKCVKKYKAVQAVIFAQIG